VRTPDAGVVAAIDAAAPVVAPPATEEWGEIVVKITPWCEIRVDGEVKGQSPTAPAIRVRAGRHTITCEQSTTGMKHEETIEVAAGATRRIERSLLSRVPVTLRVSTAKARVDGVIYDNGQTFRVLPGRYRAELLAGDEVTVNAFVTVGRQPCTIKDSPELACYE
jgi:hypothetical protein